jgi:hypothetical protein
MYAWDRRWVEYEAGGMVGAPMRHAASDGFASHHVGCGDTIYVVIERDRRLVLVGRLPVSRLVDQATAEAWMGEELIEKRNHALAEAPNAVVSFTRLVPEEVARALESERGARLRFDDAYGYALARQTLRAARWLTDASARRLDALLDASDDGTALTGTWRTPLTHAAKRAVELRAMCVVSGAYTDDGWVVEDVSAILPYDLRITRDGEEKHVEVKGTAGEGSAIALTANEVTHARQVPQLAVLAIVHDIEIHDPAGSPSAVGGVRRVWDPWTLDDGESPRRRTATSHRRRHCLKMDWSPGTSQILDRQARAMRRC